MRTEYQYPDADGRVRFKVVRVEKDGGKEFFQSHITDVEVVVGARTYAAGQWVPRAPSWPRPVFNLPAIVAAPDGSAVLVVEGEKTAIAAQALLGSRIIVTTWAGGTNAVKNTDWEPLKRHRVAVWPDLDMQVFPENHREAGKMMPFLMQPGTKAALKVVTATGGALVDIPDAFIEEAAWVKPSGWDLADEMPDGFGLQDVAAWIRKAFDALKVPALPAPQVHPEPAPVPTPERVNGTHVPAVAEEIEPPLLIRSATGAIKACLENARRVIEHYPEFDRLRYNAFSNRVHWDEEPLKDLHIIALAGRVQTLGVVAATTTIAEAIAGAASRRVFHPVRDYLDGLAWDGVPRLADWLIDHAGAADNEYVRAVSRAWLIQAVARVRQPGCQADAMLILEGPQGARKSSLLRMLFGDQWFTDHLPDLSQKDALVQLQGVWCIEVAELATLGRSDAAKIKQFLTSRSDRFRPPFGKVAEDFPRQCVFAGTVNPGDGYLKDPTGGRRFWPVKVTGTIDVEALAGIRDQLWAEADAAFRGGEQWWLPERLAKLATAEQEQRRESDAWEDRIAVYCQGKQWVTVPEVLEHALGMPRAADWTQVDQNRVARTLIAFGFERMQRRVTSRRQWGYYRYSRAVDEAELSERQQSGDAW